MECQVSSQGLGMLQESCWEFHYVLCVLAEIASLQLALFLVLSQQRSAMPLACVAAGDASLFRFRHMLQCRPVPHQVPKQPHVLAARHHTWQAQQLRITQLHVGLVQQQQAALLPIFSQGVKGSIASGAPG